MRRHSALLSGTAAGALAQGWPDRTSRRSCRSRAGNANDIVGRIVLDQVSKQLDKPIVIENRPGAGGTIGVSRGRQSRRRTATRILVHSSSFSAAYSLYKTLPYDTLNDFAAVIPLGKTPTVLVVPPSKGCKTARRADRRRQGQARRDSTSPPPASAPRRISRPSDFASAPGFEAQHVPFRGPNEAFTEVMAGRIDFYFLPLAPALPLVKEGQLIALAVSTDTRAGAARCADHRRAGFKDSLLPVLDRHVRAGQDAARRRSPSSTTRAARRCRFPRCRSDSPRSAPSRCR